MESIESLALNPQGHLKITSAPVDDQAVTNAAINDKKIITAFKKTQEYGLLALIAQKEDPSWPKYLKYWRVLVSEYLHLLCQSSSDPNASIGKIRIPEDYLENFTASVPLMLGSEYCTKENILQIWQSFDVWVRDRIATEHQGLGDFLAKELPLWHQIGRVCFHLAENKQSEEHPFAFIATYAAALSSNSKVQYKPLGKALQEYAGDKNKKALTNLVRPISDAAKQCAWLNELVENHDIYHPLAWTPDEAHNLLKSVPALEESGLSVKLPNWWKKRAKPKVQVTIGNNKTNHFGAKELLQFDVNVAIEGEPLSYSEINELMASQDGLVLLRGQWVELDKDKLAEALAHWQQVKKEAGNDGLSFIEGMRLLAGVNQDIRHGGLADELQSWCGIEASSSLKDILKSLRSPETLAVKHPGKLLQAKLRHYQESGVAWLDLLTELGLGACLADDMGLGKTIQIIALLLIKNKKKQANNPSLLILPASLLANWKSEIERFAPSLRALMLHSSELNRSDLEGIARNPDIGLHDFDLVITTYGMLLRQKWLTEVDWELVILDEAQAIKNPSSRQTQQAKKLSGKARIALTGTPVENRLGDLWSLFDFICPGLLGGATRFKSFIKSLEKSESGSYAPLRQLVSPYILRRLKTDKKVISDLPDKTEVEAWCGLSKAQAKLYGQSVAEMARALQATTEGIKRRGLVLTFLTRFKQICNHPSQLLGDDDYAEKSSGKFARLRELCEEIASRQEKVLVFTQYRQMTKPLQLFLADIFLDDGLVLHGGTPVKQRKKLVENFQSENGSPFFVLSLKAAGTGLNLTAASHVIHFDRWWNPAVENQATDRAYRIGQKKNVLVHKFICKGTVEEKINQMITEKQALANDVLESGGEAMLTEMNDEQLLNLVALDINQTNI